MDRALLAYSEYGEEYYFERPSLLIWQKKGKFWIRPICTLSGWPALLGRKRYLRQVTALPAPLNQSIVAMFREDLRRAIAEFWMWERQRS